jgi:hypothetical protein
MAEYVPSAGYGSDGKALGGSSSAVAVKGKGSAAKKKKEKDPDAPKGPSLSSCPPHSLFFSPQPLCQLTTSSAPGSERRSRRRCPTSPTRTS